eukprot:Lithocolla_globosa_v1_NODE_362_length_4309_cov_16.610576.p1 type:complete len:301 gc:universal NODE_362_length_4309_cov_16.610576:3672-2770(-)
MIVNLLICLISSKVSFSRVINPKAGKHLRAYHKDDIYKKKCIINLKNKDKKCIPRALVCLKAIREHDKRTNRIIHGRGIQRELADELISASGIIKDDDEYFDLDDIKKFELVLKTPIKVIDEDSDRGFIYTGGEYENDPFYLYKNKNHVVPITSMSAFMNTRQFCHHCNKGVAFLNKHNCDKRKKCTSCKSPDCDTLTKFIKGKWINCKECNRNFRSAKCHEEHLKFACKYVQKCKDCGMNKYSDKKHHCGESPCSTCGVMKKTDDTDHQCFMQQVKLKPTVTNTYFTIWKQTRKQGPIM